MSHVYHRCTRKKCPTCEGLGRPKTADWPPVRLQDGASPEWTCPSCGQDGLWCQCNPCTACNGYGSTSCGGCRPDSGLDCTYETLACCQVCNCFEGSLLPFCPERKIGYDEQQVIYAHYGASTGPFARPSFKHVEGALHACQALYSYGKTSHWHTTLQLVRAVADLLSFIVSRPVCAICSRQVPLTDGGVVEPAHEWICNACLVGRICP